MQVAADHEATVNSRNEELAVIAKAKQIHEEAVAKYGSAAGEDPFAKIKGLITDMIAKLEKEAEEDANEKAFCDEEMAKTEAKKQDLESTVEALTSKIDRAAATSAKRKSQVKELSARLAALQKEQADMDTIRAEENADYTAATDDLKQALNGVQKALGVLRDYYGGAAALLQQEQPAKPAKHEKSTGAGQS